MTSSSSTDDTWFETQVNCWEQEETAGNALIPFQALVRAREVRWNIRVSNALIPFQALVRARVVRWQYPLYALTLC